MLGPLRAVKRLLGGKPGQPFIHKIDYPPANIDLHDIGANVRGWVSSNEPVVSAVMTAEGIRDDKVQLVPRPDVERAIGGRYSCHIGFESGILIRDWWGKRDHTEIVVALRFASGAAGEIRVQLDFPSKAAKFEKIVPLLACPECHRPPTRSGNEFRCSSCGTSFRRGPNSMSFLTDEFAKQFAIVDTENVSAWEYDERIVEIIEKNPGKMFLDNGAGYRRKFYSNVINFEIVDYPSTDVTGVSEKLPFADNSLDGVFSVAVLEHVKDPFLCAREIMRVMKPGGVLFCAVPFLQPLHAYPHHYYNMTAQGLANLFAGLDIREQYVPLSLHPMTSVRWILKAYLEGLPEGRQPEFERMTIRQLLDLPEFQEWYKQSQPLVHELKKEKWTELAGGNCLIAYKR